MADLPGIKRPDLQTLPQIKERMTFLYLEHCKINRQDGAITVTDARGVVHVPGAGIGVLMLGPGTNMSHRAMELLGDSGATILWVGEAGVRYYAHGRPLTQSARMLSRQAELVSNTRSRLAIARRMYQMRFPGEHIAHLNMQQLRGREGARVRDLYKKASRENDVPWSGRAYDPQDFEAGSDINKALSSAHACLYGVCHCVIAALGLAPGLGFVHTGHERSFVYDIADLYKADITIPLAFQTVAEKPDDIAGAVRRKVRDHMASSLIMERVVKDIQWLLMGEADAQEEQEISVIRLWDDRRGNVAGGVQYRAWEGDGSDMQEDADDALIVGYGNLHGQS